MKKPMERTFIDFTIFPIISAEIDQDLSREEGEIAGGFYAPP
jgi:hypothetical protein